MHVRPQLLAQPWHRLPCSLQTALMQCAVRGLTIRSSRTRFATPTTWQNSLPCCWLRYARRLNSSVSTQGGVMSKLQETKESLVRMQRFEAESLSRESDLGARFSLSAAVEPAKKLIRLYNQLGASALEDFPDDILDQIKRQADADFNRFQALLDFAPDEQQN